MNEFSSCPGRIDSSGLSIGLSIGREDDRDRCAAAVRLAFQALLRILQQTNSRHPQMSSKTLPLGMQWSMHKTSLVKLSVFVV